MEFTYEATLEAPPDEVFERLRHFHRVYPEIHPAHHPLPEGEEPGLLALGYAFVLSESFGPEHRRYAFRVSLFDRVARRITLHADSSTERGRLRVSSRLEVDFQLSPLAAGTRLLVTQRVDFNHPLFDRLFNRAWLWPSVRRHVEEESRVAVELLMREAYATPASVA